jgi:hypothetical protein
MDKSDAGEWNVGTWRAIRKSGTVWRRVTSAGQGCALRASQVMHVIAQTGVICSNVSNLTLTTSDLILACDYIHQAQNILPEIPLNLQELCFLCVTILWSDMKRHPRKKIKSERANQHPLVSEG